MVVLSACLNVTDEYWRECLAILVGRKLRSGEVEECLTALFCARGDDTGSEPGPGYRHDRLERSASRISYSVGVNDPPGSLLGCFLPLHNRLQPDQRFSETNIISISIFITR